MKVANQENLLDSEPRGARSGFVTVSSNPFDGPLGDTIKKENVRVMRGKRFSHMDAKVCIDAMNQSVPLDIANARFSARYEKSLDENQQSIFGQTRVSKASMP